MILDQATLVVNSGNFFVAPVGTAAPADFLNPGAAWRNVGHTSLDNILKFASDGGEAKSLGTLQKKQMRTSYSARTEKMSFVAQQFDDEAFKLYYGSNMDRISSGSPLMGVPDSPVAAQHAVLIVFVDQDSHIAFYAPKAELFRDEDLDIGDTESLVGLPIAIKPSMYSTNNWAYAVTPKVFNGTATGATAGSPGSFTPAATTAPFNLEELRAEVVADPLTAWTTGQHVVLGDGSHAYWDGDSWEAGDAA